MIQLSNSILNYYISHFEELPFDKQLHFASRLYLWSGNDFCRQQLERLRPAVTSDEDTTRALREVHDSAQNTIHHGSKNASTLRAPYFERYPDLRGLAMVLFRYTFLKTIYGLDARGTLDELYPPDRARAIIDAMFTDDKAVAILSTHAINVQYLYSRVVMQDDQSFDPTPMLAIGRNQYDFSDPIQLQLYIYLYTHCIIGESWFYAREVPETYRAVYEAMLAELAEVIGSYFEDVNLDNKFEYLVCCRLLRRESELEARIYAEAAASMSEAGDWIIDRHNNNPQTANTTLDLSEHRNVLCIMAGIPFRAASL